MINFKFRQIYVTRNFAVFFYQLLNKHKATSSLPVFVSNNKKTKRVNDISSICVVRTDHNARII